ncbi:hypothetical protein [Exiguobacterium sp. s102]|uniref:hypothetical protein n=1 Tax=Exiguobacterium sp. s102 TaxID=2751212 RepID=UPI001BE6FD42|nr:hypothetical protein [Exiguobacterium sp. s102]
MGSGKKQKKPVKPIVRIIAIGLWILVGVLVATTIFSDDDSTAKNLDYKVTQ